MRIIDKTPLIDEKGNLGLVQRIQGILEYGFNWPRELQAQNAIVKFFDRQLEKGYTLIRNIALGQSGIIIPMILLGPAGIYVIEVTHLRGRYEARGDSWNVASGNQYSPAPVNLIQQTMRKARALQVFIERQGVRLPVTVEPLIIAGDPGLHIESVRSAVKVMMIDGIKSFVNGLLTGSPILSSMQVNDFTDRILEPRPKVEAPPPVTEPAPEPQSRAGWEETYGWSKEPTQPPQPEPSRARAIFDASKEAPPLNPSDFDFALEENAPAAELPPVPDAASPAQPIRPTGTKSRRILGMTPLQLGVIAALGLALLCLLAAFAYIVLVNPKIF
jgi:hypothetical protein